MTGEDSGHGAWRQGDYTLSRSEILSVEDWTDDMDVAAAGVKGLVVATQTCDIVNPAPDKEYVVLCPLIEVSVQMYEDVRKGRSPFAALLEHPPGPNIVVDLGRMMSVRKSALVGMERREGFTTDEARVRFAWALERKYGRFAFPDAFSNSILAGLRKRILDSHGKQASEHGKSYRSLQTARVTGFPRWDAEQVTVTFHFVLEPEAKLQANRNQISKTLDEHLSKLVWPPGFVPSDPPYHLVTLEEMTAAEWTQSRAIDWEFISFLGMGITTP